MRTTRSRRASSFSAVPWLSPLIALGLIGAGFLACSSSEHLDPPLGTTAASTTGEGGAATTTTTTASTAASTSAGTGGSGPMGMCKSNPDCPYPTDICDTVTHSCVECVVSADCGVAKEGTVCSLGKCVCPTAADTYCKASGPVANTPGWQPARCVDTTQNQSDCGDCGHACFGACNAAKCADAWEPVKAFGAPAARTRHTAVWTGTQMIVWGGKLKDGTTTNTGGLYDPANGGTWTAMSTANAPSDRIDATAIWDATDNVMVVWGGRDGNTPLGTGALYYPATNTWKPMPTDGAMPPPSARYGHTVVWTGTQMIVWGGNDGKMQLSDGALYDPKSNAWQGDTGMTPPTFLGREAHTAVWGDSTMLVFGGFGTDPMAMVSDYQSDGAFYDLTNWGLIAPSTLGKRSRHTAVWTGASMLVFGGIGSDPNGYLDDAARLKTNAWVQVTTPKPAARADHTAVWIKESNASGMIIWGGKGAAGFLDDGYSLDEMSLTWSGPLPSAPSARSHHTAVVNGSQMIIWGGEDGGGALGDGAIFDASTL